MKIALTAGYPRAAHAIALAGLLTRAGHDVGPIFVVSPWNARRIRTVFGRGGFRLLSRQALRALGVQPAHSAKPLTAVLDLLHREGIRERTLGAWARRHGAAIHSVRDLNEPSVVATLRAAKVDGLAYAGGGILRQPLLDAVDGKVLNAHSGPLPEVRGMNACEWSILLGLAPTVSIHFIGRGIDTGPVVGRIAVPIREGDDVESLRDRCAAIGAEALAASAPALAAGRTDDRIEPASTRQCYVLAPVLRELLDRRLLARTASS